MATAGREGQGVGEGEQGRKGKGQLLLVGERRRGLLVGERVGRGR